MIAVLRAHGSAQVTVGAAAFKWAHAWRQLDQDFHQFHMYDWIDTYWPHDAPPADYDLADKPVVMGELPLGPLTAGAPYLDVIGRMYAAGYAGALGWQYNEATAAQLADLRHVRDRPPVREPARRAVRAMTIRSRACAE